MRDRISAATELGQQKNRICARGIQRTRCAQPKGDKPTQGVRRQPGKVVWEGAGVANVVTNVGKREPQQGNQTNVNVKCNVCNVANVLNRKMVWGTTVCAWGNRNRQRCGVRAKRVMNQEGNPVTRECVGTVYNRKSM